MIQSHCLRETRRLTVDTSLRFRREKMKSVQGAGYGAGDCGVRDWAEGRHVEF